MIIANKLLKFMFIQTFLVEVFDFVELILGLIYWIQELHFTMEILLV